MTPSLMTYIVAARPCPECAAGKGVRCWSQFLGRRMVNQIHSLRRRGNTA